MTEYLECPRCEGTGRIPDLEEPKVSEDGRMPCPTCEGDGRIVILGDRDDVRFMRSSND